MRGSCCLHAGVLYVRLWDKTAHVAAFDLDEDRVEERLLDEPW